MNAGQATNDKNNKKQQSTGEKIKLIGTKCPLGVPQYNLKALGLKIKINNLIWHWIKAL